MYALFHLRNQISKAHSSHRAAFIEAIERGVVVRGSGADFIGDQDLRDSYWLLDNFEIREIDGDQG